MREHLYRGKRKDNGEWVYGYFRWLADVPVIYPKPDDNRVVTSPVEVCPETVGEFTGRRDKDGTQIFEDDIVKINGWYDAAGHAGYGKNLTIVDYDKEICGFNPMCNYDCDCDVYHPAEKCEVIGNIHDNPELLKRGGERMTNEERIAELERQLKETKHLHEIDRFNLMDQANQFQAMAQKLEEQLQNSIVPKFKVGQAVWCLGPHNVAISFVVDEIFINANAQGCTITYEEQGYAPIPQSFIFATREEAEKALAERGAK